MSEMKVVARRSTGARAQKKLPAEVVHCPGCGRIWVRDAETPLETCRRCRQELHPTGKAIVVGEELRLADGNDVRVSQDKFLQELHLVFSAMVDQEDCECKPGVVCLRCRAISLLRKFPTIFDYESGSLEDAWATLRPHRKYTEVCRPETQTKHGPKRPIPLLVIDMDDD